jgi:type IV secretory pathway VirB2 component (pilin)
MHRWSVHTWKGFCTIPQENKLMQEDLPREALKHPFLLHGMFASAALDLATSCQNNASKAARYAQEALKYYNTSSGEFRRELDKLRPEIVHLLFVHAALGASACLVIPQSMPAIGERDPWTTATQRVISFFSMAIGATTIIKTYRADFDKAFPSVGAVRDLIGPSSLRFLAIRDKSALDLIATIATRSHNRYDDGQLLPRNDMYSRAIEWLMICFAAQAQGSVKGYFMSFPEFCGPRFLLAVKERDSMALLLLMYWGVLLHRSRTYYWWVGSTGRQLNEEVSTVLLALPFSKQAGVSEAVSWAVRQTCQEEQCNK